MIRTWNVFHGNAMPPGRVAHLEEMVRLATADRPDVLCLQEVPVWALSRLEAWSGMIAVGDVAARPRLGPLPVPAELGRRLTDIHHGVLRSAFSGQANAILLAAALPLRERGLIVLNPRSFRSQQARALGLVLRVRLAWAKERRVCQAVRIELPGGETAVVANLHATASSDPRVPDAEVRRAAVFVAGFAQPSEPVVLAGDFNVRREESPTLAELASPEWRFSEAGLGIDHVLVRGPHVTAAEIWPEHRRRVDSRLLSDHAPVEVVVG